MLEVRPERPEDFAAIRRVHELAFAPSPVEADLVAALRDEKLHVPELCLVAVDEASVLGHILFSEARLDTGPTVLALAPMAVRPERQRLRIGSALVAEALRRAAQTEYPLVVVLGHPDYYPRFGFEPAAALGVVCPFEVPTEAWMVFRLPAYAGEEGELVYPDAFGV